MNLLALLPVIIQYAPKVIAFVQQEGPAIQQFVRDVEAALNQAQATVKPNLTTIGTGPNLHNLGPGGTFIS